MQPKSLTVDRSIGARRAAQEVRLAQQLYTFWNTGRQRYLDAAISPQFRDNTLPPGRPQGPAGPLAASKTFRAAVPDLTCELSDVLVTGDRITARLVFRGRYHRHLQRRPGRGPTSSSTPSTSSTSAPTGSWRTGTSRTTRRC
ncbi:hypothetical protein KAURM247S_02368 [Kitasatospora aureofaciens]